MEDMNHFNAIKRIRSPPSSSSFLEDIPTGAFHPSAQITTGVLDLQTNCNSGIFLPHHSGNFLCLSSVLPLPTMTWCSPFFFFCLQSLFLEHTPRSFLNIMKRRYICKNLYVYKCHSTFSVDWQFGRIWISRLKCIFPRIIVWKHYSFVVFHLPGFLLIKSMPFWFLIRYM